MSQEDQPNQYITLAELTPDMVTGSTTPTVLLTPEEIAGLTKIAIDSHFEDPVADLSPPVSE